MEVQRFALHAAREIYVTTSYVMEMVSYELIKSQHSIAIVLLF